MESQSGMYTAHKYKTNTRIAPPESQRKKDCIDYNKGRISEDGIHDPTIPGGSVGSWGGSRGGFNYCWNMDRNDRLVFVEVIMKLMMLLIKLYLPLSCCSASLTQCAETLEPVQIIGSQHALMRINCIHLKSMASESVENLWWSGCIVSYCWYEDLGEGEGEAESHRGQRLEQTLSISSHFSCWFNTYKHQNCLLVTTLCAFFTTINYCWCTAVKRATEAPNTSTRMTSWPAVISTARQADLHYVLDCERLLTLAAHVTTSHCGQSKVDGLRAGDGAE